MASEATRATILGSAPWLPAERVHLLPKGIDSARFRPADTSPSTRAAGFAGQFVVRKGLRELMTAWSVIDTAERPDRPRLLLAGDGPLRDEVERWRAGLRDPGAVELRGWLDDPAAFSRRIADLMFDAL